MDMVIISIAIALFSLFLFTNRKYLLTGLSDCSGKNMDNKNKNDSNTNKK